MLFEYKVMSNAHADGVLACGVTQEPHQSRVSLPRTAHIQIRVQLYHMLYDLVSCICDTYL